MLNQRLPRLTDAFAVASVAVCLTSCATTSSTDVQIPAQNVTESNMPNGTLPAIPRPDAKPPHPVVILLHDCDGAIMGRQAWARRFDAWGYASANPDSYMPPRRICSGPAEAHAVTPQDRAGDVVSTTLRVCMQPGIDSNYMADVGFSNRGWSAMRVAQRLYQQSYPNLIRAAVSYYGSCDRAAQAIVAIAATATSAAISHAGALLQGLIGKDEATIERSIGLPDEKESNGVQTLLHYRSVDSWQTSGRTDGFRGRTNFDCLTTLVLRDGILRAYEQNGSGCR